MKFDEETLIEIEDYINALDESVGLESPTLIDIDKAIAKKRKELKKLTIQNVSLCAFSNCLEPVAKHSNIYCIKHAYQHTMEGY